MKERAKTEWLGLWETQRDGVYCSSAIRKGDIPAYASVIVRDNMYYQQGGNRPRFVFCFAVADAARAITVKQSKDEYASFEELSEHLAELKQRICLTEEDLHRIINSLDPDGYYTVSDFIRGRGIDTKVIA